MYLFENKGNDNMMDVDRTYEKQQLIQLLKNKFQTYGYDEISTSNFGQYDLYAQMNGTVNHEEMIKTIDNTGQVLVLRPDVTIPLTERIARQTKTLPTDLRYFYVLDVFRQAIQDEADRERTQAGVEYLGNATPQADAEIIALAVEILQEVGTDHFTVEVGHAGFFKQLVNELALSDQQLNELTSYIQAKNVPELEQFTKRLQLEEAHSTIIQSLPFLYGEKNDVMNKTKALPLSDELKRTLDNLSHIFNVLTSYGVADNIVIDLSLINHMDYYSDVIFQGFIKQIGKPVMMGGRYDTLSKQFDATIPAIGFAIDINTLFNGIDTKILPKKSSVDFLLSYAIDMEKKSLQLAKALRQLNYSVMTYPLNTSETSIEKTKEKIIIENGTFVINNETFTATDDVLQYLKNKER